jgi:tetratricopeptide (TPR) repeat protein
MEGKKYFAGLILLVVGISFGAQTGFSQASISDQIYKAYATGNMTKWYKAMKSFEESADTSILEKKMELINYYYGYTGWLVSVDKDDLARDYIKKTELLLEKILEKDAKNATVLAYKAAFIAFEIAMSNYKAIYLGTKSSRFIDQALEIESNNIQALIERGNELYYSPSAFGGDKELSIVYYKKATKRMEDLHLDNKNWMYLNVMTSLGLAYEATDQIQNAKLCYEKILQVEPDFMWVGDELYPDMLKRHNL